MNNLNNTLDFELMEYLRQSKLQEYSLSRNHWRAIERACNKRLTDQLNETYKYNPEYIYIENERVCTIEFFYKELKKRIAVTPFYDILMVYVNCKNNALATAKELGVSHTTINNHLKKLQGVVDELLQELGLPKDEFKSYFTPEISNYFASSSTNVGYPFEHYMNLPKDKEWQDKFGTKRTKEQNTCLIPEYLQACGLCNCQCNICTDTNNCRRKDAFPDNDRAGILKRSKAKIEECINNAIANTSASAYSGLERIYQI